MHAGITAAVYGLAVEKYFHPTQVHLVGFRKDHAIRQFRMESLRAYNPMKVVEVVDHDADAERLKKLGYSAIKKPMAYICAGETCNSVEDPVEIVRKIGGWFR